MAVGVLALVGAAGAGGWMAYGRQPRPVRLTSAPAPVKIAYRPAPPAPAELQEKLDTLARRWREPVGVSVTDVASGWTAQVNGSEVFPQESVSKLWVALSVFDAIDRGALRADQPIVLTEQDRSVFYQPVTAGIRRTHGFQTTVGDLLRRQLTLSDNAANDKLIAELGGGPAVTRTMAAKGLTGLGVGETERDLQTRVAGLVWRPDYGHTWIFKQARDALPDAVRDQALAQYLAAPADGAQPAALTRSLAALKRGELLSPASTQAMIELMGECRTGASRLRAGLPGGWAIAHKTGTGPDWRGASVGINDVGLITAPDGRTFAVAVMMRETKKPVPERLAFFHQVARAVVDSWRENPAQPLRAPDRRMAAASLAAPELAR